MTNEKYQNKYRIPSARLQGYDYGLSGAYFVTICTKNRIHYFGEIVETDYHPSLRATTIGKIAHEYWSEIPNHFPFVMLDEFVIMPDHVHGILIFNKPDKHDWQPNVFGSQSRNLGSVIRGFKASVKRYANENGIQFEWLARYYDRVVRDEDELNRIRNYIKNNPAKWLVQTDDNPSLHKK